MLQIIETRILSVVAYYYLAFFAIGMAMFGMTAGSLFVYFREQLFSDARLMQNLVWISSAFAITVVLSGFLTTTTVLTGVSGGASQLLTTALQWGKLVVILATPYFFAGMAISDDPKRIAEWIPLVMEGRSPDVPVAATRMMRGTDVNFGALTRSLITWIDEVSGFAIELVIRPEDLFTIRETGGAG